jgi:tetratricopeptide (TPR) repeat protein
MRLEGSGFRLQSLVVKPAGCARRESIAEVAVLPSAFRFPFSALLFLCLLPAPAAAQDTVYLSSTAGSRGFTKLTGRVADYTGRQLVLETAGGQRTYPAEKVIQIETEHTPQQVEADARMARGDFASAVALYGQARDADPRTWVRRQITAEMVWCHQALDQLPEAGEQFLILVRSDPDTPYFDCIPLAWAPAQPSRQLEQAALGWLARDDLPAAVLLGASHLMMNTSSSSAAVARLSQLAAAGDPRIAPLAVAQVWRAAIATTDQKGLDRWQQAIERMPEPLRAGPYYVLGQAEAYRQEWEQAALAMMRVPILYPRHRTLAARSLLEAGRALEKLDRTSQAARLYRELIESDSSSRQAAEARLRLEELAKRRG